jgi:hypothetical protein
MEIESYRHSEITKMLELLLPEKEGGLLEG